MVDLNKIVNEQSIFKKPYTIKCQEFIFNTIEKFYLIIYKKFYSCAIKNGMIIV